MQTMRGGGGNHCAHHTAMLRRGQLEGKIPWSSEVAHRSLRKIQKGAEIFAGAWVSRVEPCTQHTQNRCLDVELRTPAGTPY